MIDITFVYVIASVMESADQLKDRLFPGSSLRSKFVHVGKRRCSVPPEAYTRTMQVSVCNQWCTRTVYRPQAVIMTFQADRIPQIGYGCCLIRVLSQ
jgi:hypothetical protein